MQHFWKKARFAAGQLVFNQWILPPLEEGRRLRRHHARYGHWYLNQFFDALPDSSIGAIEALSRPGPVLDLCGGTGRLATHLAQQGIKVTLVDFCDDMVSAALARRASISLENQRNLTIIHENVFNLDKALPPDRQFGTIVCLHNALSGLGTKSEILHFLQELKRYIKPSGKLYFEVHREEYLTKKQWWMKKKWRYTNYRRTGLRPHRIWSRTIPHEDGDRYEFQHAITSGFMRFTLNSTTEVGLPQTGWKSLFESCGYDVLSMWGSWNGGPFLERTTDTIFGLRIRQ